MLAQKEKAAAPTTAPKINQQYISYRNCVSTSRANLKEQIGELLLHLQNPFLTEAEQLQVWQLLGASLKKYLAIKHLGVRI